MGKTFSQPTYFYQDNTVPDLVDTNGPLYSRTGVNLGNVTPSSIRAINTKTLEQPMANILSHDVHAVRRVYSPMPNDTENAVSTISLLGSIEIASWASNSIGSPKTESICLLLSFSDMSYESDSIAPTAVQLLNENNTFGFGMAIPNFSSTLLRLFSARLTMPQSITLAT